MGMDWYRQQQAETRLSVVAILSLALCLCDTKIQLKIFKAPDSLLALTRIFARKPDLLTVSVSQGLCLALWPRVDHCYSYAVICPMVALLAESAILRRHITLQSVELRDSLAIAVVGAATLGGRAR